MIVCVDVGYSNIAAKAACVAFHRWEDAEAKAEYMTDMSRCAPYIPGQFYRRELPCVLAVLKRLPALPRTVVIDGYVWLDAQRRKGLGGHLFEALAESVPVIGVAKTRYAPATSAAPVLRGTSRRPVYVTAAGADQDQAAEWIRRMHGSGRIPTLLKRVDRLSRVARETK